MNINVQPSELMRQHQAHLARQARFARAAVKPAPVIVALPAPVPVEPLVVIKAKTKRIRRKVAPSSMSSIHLFSTSMSREVDWSAEYWPYATGISDKFRTRNMHEIVLSVLRAYPDVTLEDIKGRSRNRRVAFVRHHAIYAIKTERPAFSFPQIGRWMGDRDHTTCLNSYWRFKKLLEVNFMAGESK